MSEKMKNLVPAAAMSLALVGLSGMKAYAADAEIVPTPSPDTTEPPAESQEQSAVTQSSADINSASKGEVTDGENGEKKNTLTVNADEGGNNGTLDVTTTPGGTTTETTDPVTSTTTDTTENPDGSTDTTTTTTTTSTTTTTEETNTEVKGEIKGDEVTTEPTDEEKDDLKEELGDALDKEVDDGQSDPDPDSSESPAQPGETDPQKPHLEDLKQGDTIGENKEFTVTGTTGTSETTTNEQGQNVTTTTTTVTFEKVVEGTPTEGAGLTQEEFGKIVDKQFGLDGVEFTTNENGVISYVDPATGATVTVRLVQNTGTSTTNTTYTIEVSQTKTVVEEMTESGTTDVGGSTEKPDGTTVYDPVEEGKDDSADVDSFIDDVLKAADEDETVTKTVNPDGSITVTDGNMQYDITITETTLSAADVAGNKAHQVQLLGDGYVLSADGQKILTADGGYEVDVTTDALTGKAIMRTIKVTDLHAGQDDQTTKTEDEITADTNAAIEQAVSDAVVKALEAEDAKDFQMVGEPINHNGVWTVKVTATVGGVQKEFTYTVDTNVTDDVEKWSVNKSGDANYVDGSGSTTTNTGNASVTGETIVWNGTKTDEKITVTEDKTTGEVSFNINIDGNKFEGAEIKAGSIKETGGKITELTTTVTTVVDGKTVVTEKTYKFTYDVALSEEEVAAFLKGQGAEGATLTGLSKVTWTIDEKVTTTTPAVEDSSTTDETKNGDESKITNLPEGVTKNTDGTYSYKFTDKGEEKTIILTGQNGKWTFTTEDGKTTYTIEETSATIEDDQIVALLRQNYNIPEGVNVTISGSTASYTNSDGQRITINFTGLTGTNVTLKIDVKDQIESTKSEEDVKDQITKWVQDQVTKYGSVTFGGQVITKDTTTEKIGEIIEKVAVNSTVSFEKMSESEIKQMLLDLEQQSIKNNGSYMTESGKTYRCHVWNEIKNLRSGETFTVNGATYTKLDDYYIYDTRGNRYYVGNDGYATLPVPAGYENGTFNSKLGHIDLVSEGKLTTMTEEDGTPKQENCVILPDTVQIYLSNDAGELAKENGGTLIEMQKWFNKDNGQTFWQIKRKPMGGTDAPENYLDRTFKFYKIVGQIGYGDDYTSVGEAEIRKGTSNDDNARAYAAEHGFKKFVLIDGYYRFYKEDQIVDLTTYGYLGKENNACKNEYDIKLGNLKLVDGKVTSINKDVDVWSSDVSASKEATGWLYKLTFGNIVTTTPGTPADILIVDKDQVTDSGLAGKWTITQTKDEADLTEKKLDGTEVWKYQGSDSTSYDSYKTWVAEEMGSFTATSTEYTGSLGTSYTKPGSTIYGDLQVGKNAAGEDSVTKTLQTVRDLTASLQSTSVQQTTNSNTTTNTEHQAPREDPPEVDIPEEDPPLVDTPDEDPPEVDVPDEEPPVVDAPDEEPPLVDVPDEEPPVVDMPEEEPPVVDIPDEAPPMVDMPVEAPPVVDVADPVVPLADVPQTGDNVMLRVAAAITGLFSTLGLAVLTQKKREDEAN